MFPIDRDRSIYLRQAPSLPRVDILYVYEDVPSDPVDSAAKAGAKGIVLAGVGNGNMPKAVMDAATRAAKAGVVIVRSSRVPLGFVGRNVEVDDDKLNFVASEELNPPKARVLLRLALMKTQGKSRGCSTTTDFEVTDKTSHLNYEKRMCCNVVATGDW
jgi:L-asparaginase/Glu-tRNA(Gln) amidotransferase subunit D